MFFNPGERPMTGPTIIELDERIAMIRENVNELVEQAAAYSGAEDENRTADRIAGQEQELAKLIELRDALLRSKPYANGARSSRICRGRVSKQLVARPDRASCHTLPSSGAVPPLTRER